jgi:hypothetical protein
MGGERVCQKGSQPHFNSSGNQLLAPFCHRIYVLPPGLASYTYCKRNDESLSTLDVTAPSLLIP